MTLDEVVGLLRSMIFMLFMNEATLLALYMKLDGKPSLFLPAVKGYSKHVFNQMMPRLKKLRNDGELQAVGGSIPPSLELAFYVELKKIHDKQAPYKLTEAAWYPDRWQSLGGKSIEQLRDMFNLAESQGVLGRKNPNADNSPRILVSYGKLRERITHSPALQAETTKTA